MASSLTGDRRAHQPSAQRKRASIRILKEAVAGGRLVVHYQPIVEAASRRAASVEALLRWRHPGREHERLSALVAAAERSPVIFDLERWTVEACCREVGAWPEPLRRLRVHLNVSAREFDHAGFASRVARLVRRAGLEPARIALEITETSALRDPEAVGGLLEGLKGAGFQVWLDDFGSGHSSLLWLRHLPIDGLKLPGDLVAGVSADRRMAAIAEAVIHLAHDLGLQVVAEGIEAEADLQWLLARGADQLQGFLFCAPTSSEELRDWLGSRA